MRRMQKIGLGLTLLVFSTPLFSGCTPADCVTVQSGDTLYELTQTHFEGYTYQEVADANDIKNPSLIYPGDQICSPGGYTKPTITGGSGSGQPKAKPEANLEARVGGVLSRKEFRKLLRSVGFPEYTIPYWETIVECESSFRPWIVSPDGDDNGLFQINGPTWKKTYASRWPNILDARTNAEIAYEISKGGIETYLWACGAAKDVPATLSP